MQRLEGKVILVAGAGGIGDVLARRYAAEGAAVVLGDLNADAAAEVTGVIARDGGRAIATRLDGGDEGSNQAAVRLAVETFGGLDGLHANFANFSDTAIEADVLSLPLAAYDETMRVNARGFLLATRAALPAILERGGGSIIYTSSGSAWLGETVRVAYGMSKAAGHALMRHVAARYGASGVRANVIAPGLILHDRWTAENRVAVNEWIHALGLLGRTGAPRDIAALGALLMSDEGGFITGQALAVDGGSTLRP